MLDSVLFGIVYIRVSRKNYIFYAVRNITCPTVSKFPYRLRSEVPSTCEGNGSNYFISVIIGCAYRWCPTAKGVCTIGGFVLIAIYIGCIHRVFGFDFGVIGGVVCRKGNTFGSIAAPIVVDCVNLLFRCPFCGQGDIFAGGFNCFLVLVDSALIFPTQEFIILRGGFHLPNSVII